MSDHVAAEEPVEGGGGPAERAALSLRQRLILSLISALTGQAVFAAILFAFPVIYDTDSYFHLAIGRAYALFGQIHELPWARFSLMADTFGDKELLFHWLIAPFARLFEGPAAGRWALSFLIGLVFAALAWLSMRAVGRLGLIVPWLVFFASLEFFGRAIRLRPEMLSLLLLLLALWCAGRGWHRGLGVVALVYTLSYTAFHALLVLCAAWFVFALVTRRRFEPGLLLYPILGAGAGLLLHPSFPDNLLIWKVQSIDFFRYGDVLDLGLEIGAPTLGELFLPNIAWLAGLLLLVLTTRGSQQLADEPVEATERFADRSLVAAFCFLVLYVLGRRFVVYAVPLISIAVVWQIAHRRRLALEVAPPIEVAGQRERARFYWPAVIALVAVVVVAGGLPLVQQVRGMAREGSELEREDDWRLAADALPRDATVAAEWGLGQLFVYFAPQASFLNVLDPVFMYLPHQEAYYAQRALFTGLDPDPVLTVARDLDSRFLLLSRYHQPAEVVASVESDPRWQVRYGGHTVVAERHVGGQSAFFLDWRLVPPGTPVPVPDAVAIEEWPRYPRLEGEAAAIEGFVDLERFGLPASAGSCAVLVGELTPTAGTTTEWELAAWGATKLWVRGEELVSLEDARRSTPGSGINVAIGDGSDRAATTRVTVLSCFDEATGRAGFSFLRRS